MRTTTIVAAIVLLAGGVAVAAPTFAPDSPYKQVRERLMESGWHPASGLRRGGCGTDECPPYPEVLFCSGVGRSVCIYGWEKRGRYLKVSAWGENYRNQKFDALQVCRSLMFDRNFGWRCR